MKAVKHTHLYIPKSEILGIEDLRQALTITSIFDYSVCIPTYKETQKAFGIPLYYPLEDIQTTSPITEVQDIRMLGSKTLWKVTTKPRDGQRELLSRFLDLHADGRESFLVEAKPGVGKTYIAMCMMSFLQRTALVVVPKSDLVKQWVNRFLEHTNLTRDKIGIADEGRCDDVTGKAVFVGLIHTLGLDRFGDAFKNFFGTIVFDEVDRSMPPTTFAPVIGMFPTQYRIGLSATMTRSDGLHKVFEHHLGTVKLLGKDEGRMVPKVILHRFRESSGKIFNGLQKNQRRGVLISKLASNFKRNALIASYVASVYRSGRRLIIVSDRTMQLFLIQDILETKYHIPRSEMGFYAATITRPDGRSMTITKKQQEHTAKTKKIIGASYGLIKMGTDIPDVACIIYATPQTDIEQSRGRIERMVDGKLQPVVIDIMDMKYAETIRWGASRIRSYRNMKMEVKEY